MEIEHQDAMRAAVGALEKLRVDYFLFGANAQNIWGEPRYTKDADFILVLGDERFEELIESLAAAGFTVDPPKHLSRLKTGRMIKLYHGNITVDFVLGETEFDQSALARRKRVEYADLPLYVASPEDVILYKLIAHRFHDLGDIEKIIRRQRASLDRAYLRKWAKWLVSQTDLKRIETTLRRMLAEFGKRPR